MIDLESGYINLFMVKDIPVRLHWSLPIGFLILVGFQPLTWVLLGLIILLHEVGHAVLVHHYRHEVISIDLWGLGGFCRWYPIGDATQHERSVIAWGGVIVQTVILALAGLAILIFGYPTSGVWLIVAHMCIELNAMIIALNLIPIHPLDGYEAWKLVTRKIK